MKTRVIFIFALVLAVNMFAQGRRHQGPPREKLEQLERIKLLEVLDLDEEKTIRFFSRRDEHKDEMKQIFDERRDLIHNMEQALKDNKSEEDYDYSRNIQRLMEFEKDILKSREKYINSLKDLLTSEQIATVVVFENLFLREIRESLLKGRGRRE